MQERAAQAGDLGYVSDPLRSRKRRLPWHAAPHLVTARGALLWALRRKRSR